MISLTLLSCCTIMVSAVPAHPNVLPTLLSQGGATQGTNQQLDAQTPAPLSPKVEQPQPLLPQPLGPQGGPQLLPPIQHYARSSLGGSPMMIPLQMSVHRPQPAVALPQQPLMFPPNTYVAVYQSPYGNQLFSPYGFPMILASPLQQTATNQSPNAPVLAAGTPSGAAPSGNSPQPIQQQQNPQIIYMLQQPMNAALGSLSSEELQMAAEMGQLGVYLPAVLTNPSAGAVQPVNQAAGLTNPEQQGIAPTLGTLSAGDAQTQGPASSGLQLSTDGVPAGLEGPTQAAATVQTPVETKVQPTPWRNRV